MPVVSTKVDERTKELMELHEEINWSAVARNAIKEKLEELDEEPIDEEQAEQARESMVELRQKHSRYGKKSGSELIREWRDKR